MTRWIALLTTRVVIQPNLMVGVRAQPSGTKVPSICREPVQIPLKPTRNKVSWRDVVLAHHVTSNTRSTRLNPFKIQATAE